MYLPDFDYHLPETLNEACGLLAQFGEQARVLAGGTDLLPHMKNELIAPEILVSLKGIEGLREIEYIQGKGVAIGAGATENDLVNSKVLREKFPSISEAAATMANAQIRNRGTIGGNIVSAVPSADLPPILIALKASVTLIGKEKTRAIPLEDFFAGPRRTVIHSDEILAEIIIPDQGTTGSAYVKLGLRNSGALAVVGVAANVISNGVSVREARIVLGAVGPTPMRANKAEDLLIGNSVTEALLEKAGRIASMECSPISDIRGSEEYRRDMVRVFTERALRKALQLPVFEGTEVR
jgi:carbon-monoxide dehydrogenase medium subunit